MTPSALPRAPFGSRLVGPRAAAGLVLLLLLTGCVGMPTAGPVIQADVPAEADQEPGTAYQPSRPAVGASAQEIVLGFLEALKAVPVRTTTAAEFLTAEGRTQWQPEQGTVTYSALSVPQGQEQVTVDARDSETYDRAGRWTRAGSGTDKRLSFSLEQVGGEWRISRAPDALVVPRTWFADQYSTANLYFLDPSERTVVPEPVHAPDGSQLATSLVRGLLAGPGDALNDVMRSAVPASATLATPSVPVSEIGVAEVALNGPEEALERGVGKGLAAQLAWTLRQVPGVRRVKVSWNGEPVVFRGGASEAAVSDSEEFAPWGPLVSDDLYGLVGGRLVSGLPDRVVETTGPFGRKAMDLRQVAVAWDGSRAVGVDGNGSGLLLAPVREPRGEGPGLTLERLLAGRTDLVSPAFDGHGRVWVLDRTRRGPEVLVIDRGRVRTVDVPDLPEDVEVRRMLVSPDATRLVLLTREDGQDRIVLSRLVQDPGTGGVRGLPVEPIVPQLPAGRQVLDLAWGPGASVAVMSQLTEDLADTITVVADGSRAEAMAPATLRLRPGAAGLAMTPVLEATSYVFTGQVLRDLREPAHVLVEMPEGITDVMAPG